MLKRVRVLSIVLSLIAVLFLSACTNSVEFTINFNSNGGSDVTSITTDGSSTIILPDDPTKDGYSFAGWYWDNNTFSNPFTVNSLLDSPISSNLTVYAKWVEGENIPIGSLKVAFDSQGGTDVDAVYVLKNNTVPIPNTSREGYTLDGWYTSLNGGVTLDERWSFTSNIVTSNITLYAKWIKSIDLIVNYVNTHSNNVLNGYKTVRYYTLDAYNTYYDLYVDGTQNIRIQYTTSSRSLGFSFLIIFELGEIKNGTFVGVYPDPIESQLYELIGGASYNTSTKTLSVDPIPSISTLPNRMYDSSLNLAILSLPYAIEYYRVNVFVPLGIILS